MEGAPTLSHPPGTGMKLREAALKGPRWSQRPAGQPRPSQHSLYLSMGSVEASPSPFLLLLPSPALASLVNPQIGIQATHPPPHRQGREGRLQGEQWQREVKRR